MSTSKIVNNVTRKFNRVGFTIKKHSPEILLATGIVGVVASAVMACKATTKAGAILEEAKKNIDDIHRCEEEFAPEHYSKEDAKKDLAIVYAQTGLKFAKTYGPAIILGALSITSILASHDLLRKRNVALAAAYATVDNGFKEYRSRVVERFGKELDKELKYNIKAKEVEEVVVGDDGKETVAKQTVTIADINNYSDYARVFDESCIGWEKDAEHNLYFLKVQQEYANQKLKAQGYLYLNDVYDMLGIPRTKAGQIVGWVYDEKNPVGDNYVDFGVYDITRERVRAFINGYERNIILEFNVDGDIWSLMK